MLRSDDIAAEAPHGVADADRETYSYRSQDSYRTEYTIEMQSQSLQTPKGVVVCIPGLGGHESSLREYVDLLHEYDVRLIQLVNHRQTLADMIELCRREQAVIFLCNCYGLQLALRASDELPGKIRGIIVIEAFFPEFHSWSKVALVLNTSMLAIIRFFGRLGVKRRRFWTGIDYARLAKYPMAVQPLFDMLWQNLEDYFWKIEDILPFRLPRRVTIPTLFILSPKGYFRSQADRARVQKIFAHSHIVEVTSKSHNIVALAAAEIVAIIRLWLAKAPQL